MLPDFPELKAWCIKRLRLHMKEVVKAEFPLLQVVSRKAVHEGRRSVLSRDDGSTQTIDMKEFSGTVSINLDEIEAMTPPVIVEKFTEAGKQMAAQKAKEFFRVITDSVREVGNALDAGGRPFSGDLYLEMLETMTIAFDEHRQPMIPTIYANSTTGATVRDVLAKAFEDREFKRRYTELIEGKWIEWRDRESNRKLVG